MHTFFFFEKKGVISVRSVFIVMLFSLFIFFILYAIIQTGANATVLPFSNNSCTVKHGNGFLKEGEGIIIRRKLFKVEDCHLQRAYHACGARLWFVVNMVCVAIELDEATKRINKYIRRFTQEKLLTEACCSSTCTISEIVRYCP
jgi:hypothetical protein